MCVFECRCIDGYSRKIIWLKASYTNHKPELIASYFTDSTREVGGYPRRVRTDKGTENVIVAAIQAAVTGSTTGHLYGTSPGNQRIEAWWSFFRRCRSQFWIELFENLSEYGAFHPHVSREIDCLRFCFMDIIQQDLDAVRREWNTHRIRPSTGAQCPAGIPDELYYLPQPPAVQCLLTDTPPLPVQLMERLEQRRSCEDVDFGLYLDYLCQHQGFHMPVDVDTATSLYFDLVKCIH